MLTDSYDFPLPPSRRAFGCSSSTIVPFPHLPALGGGLVPVFPEIEEISILNP